jgi:hypothetical protein
MRVTWLRRGQYKGEQVTVLRNDPRKGSRVIVRIETGERRGWQTSVKQADLWRHGDPLPRKGSAGKVPGTSVRTVSGGLPSLGKRQ